MFCSPCRWGKTGYLNIVVISAVKMWNGFTVKKKKAVKSLHCPGVVEPHTDVLLVCTAVHCWDACVSKPFYSRSHTCTIPLLPPPSLSLSVTYSISTSVLYPSLEFILCCFIELHSISSPIIHKKTISIKGHMVSLSHNPTGWLTFTVMNLKGSWVFITLIDVLEIN